MTQRKRKPEVLARTEIAEFLTRHRELLSADFVQGRPKGIFTQQHFDLLTAMVVGDLSNTKATSELVKSGLKRHHVAQALATLRAAFTRGQAKVGHSLSVVSLVHFHGVCDAYLHELHIGPRQRIMRALHLRTAQWKGVSHALNLGLAFISVPQGAMLEVNDKLCEITGFKRDQLLNTPVESLTDPLDCEEHKRIYDAWLHGTEETLINERRIVHANGHSLWIRTTCSRAFGRHDRLMGVVSIIENINDWRVAQQHLADTSSQTEHAHQKLTKVLNEVPIGIILADAPNGNLTFVNKKCVEVLGRGILQVKNLEDYGKQSILTMHGHPHKFDKLTLVRCLRGETVSDHEQAVLGDDGVLRPILTSGAPLYDDQNKLIGAVVSFVNITEQKRVEDEMRQSMRYQEQVIGILGHDLRSPLASISFAAQRLRAATVSDDTRQRIANRVLLASERALRMIGDLLDFTRVRMGQTIPISKQQVDIGEVCRHTIEELRGSHPKAEINFTCVGDPTVVCDPDRISQVLCNLVSNAVQYRAPDTPVKVTLSCDDSHFTLAVANAGEPIDPELLTRLFEPYRRGQDAKPGGLGLGLYIAQQITQAHQGELTVRSQREDGTCFTARMVRAPLI